MPERPKILLLDDDHDILGVYEELLGRLSSKPEVRTATTGARAIAMLEAEPYSLLVCDLNMPHMDGLQVLAVVRRKFPQLRTAVLTGLADEQFRTRAYGMGLDLYLEKPNSSAGIQVFLDCIESLLGQNVESGFRGMQSKGLVDIIQLECLCRSSSVLKITNGLHEGRIWFQDGEIIDSSAQVLTGEEAFRTILSWKTGNFELLPAEPTHPRTIQASGQSLLLETAQALDEAQGQAAPGDDGASQGKPTANQSFVRSLFQFPGVEFGLMIDREGKTPVESWAVENPEAAGHWAQKTLEQCRLLGETLHLGSVNQVLGHGLYHHIVLAARKNHTVCVGFHPSQTQAQVRDTMNNILAQRDS
jgi:CheY-like chemotaxis protein